MGTRMPQLRGQPTKWDERTSDEELVDFVRTGSSEAFGALWERHFRRVYGYCYRSLGDREIAEDAAGETFRRALSALGTSRVGKFRSWVFAIAHNVIADEFRSRKHSTIPLESITQRPEEGQSAEE